MASQIDVLSSTKDTGRIEDYRVVQLRTKRLLCPVDC